MLVTRLFRPCRRALLSTVAQNRSLTASQRQGSPREYLLAAQRIRGFATDQKASEEAQKEQNPNETRDNIEGADVPSSKGWSDSPFVTALLIVGTGLIAYGAYGLYTVMTMWPKEVRADLRSGLRAKRKGDLDTAILYFSRAWQTAKAMPFQTFGDDALLKVTGIGIALGGLLEDEKRLEEAYTLYEDTFWLLRTAYMDDLPPSTMANRPDLGIETLKGLTRADRMRAVALSYKLAEMAHDLHRPSQEEERWLVWSVEAILRTVLDAPPMTAVEVAAPAGKGTAGGEGPNVKVLIEQLGLPEWTARHDIAAPFEALGTFYAKSGNITYALPLYLQAISILIPPTPNATPVEDRCRGAQLMGNVAELMIRSMNTEQASPEAISQAEAWAKKGLDVVMAARKLSPIKYDVCEESLAMLLYNVAMIRDLSGDKVQAQSLLTQALEQSKAIGMEEGVRHSERALSALQEGKDEFEPFLVAKEEDRKVQTS